VRHNRRSSNTQKKIAPKQVMNWDDRAPVSPVYSSADHDARQDHEFPPQIADESLGFLRLNEKEDKQRQKTSVRVVQQSRKFFLNQRQSRGFEFVSHRSLPRNRKTTLALLEVGRD
jgi:hypothetical protein